MHIEGGDYLYMKRLDAPKAWFQVNADRILSVYGQEHNIQKEDLLLGEIFLCFAYSLSSPNEYGSDKPTASTKLCPFRFT